MKANNVFFFSTLEDFESESFQREPTAQAENCKETENRLPEKQKGNTEKTMPRSSLVIGLNEVIRGLEKGNLVLVLVRIFPQGSVLEFTLTSTLLILSNLRVPSLLSKASVGVKRKTIFKLSLN